MKNPQGANILKTLPITLYAEQEEVKIIYEMEDIHNEPGR